MAHKGRDAMMIRVVALLCSGTPPRISRVEKMRRFGKEPKADQKFLVHNGPELRVNNVGYAFGKATLVDVHVNEVEYAQLKKLGWKPA